MASRLEIKILTRLASWINDRLCRIAAEQSAPATVYGLEGAKGEVIDWRTETRKAWEEEYDHIPWEEFQQYFPCVYCGYWDNEPCICHAR